MRQSVRQTDRRPPGRPARREGRGADVSVREALLKAALEQFSAAEYEAVGARQITAQAGVTVSALYHHFGDKHGLYVAALRIVLDNLSHQLTEALTGSDDPEIALFNYAVALSEAYYGPRFKMVVRHHISGDEATITRLASETHPGHVAIATPIVRKVARKRDPIPTVVAISALMTGLLTARAVYASAPAPAAITQGHEEMAQYVLSIVIPRVKWDAVRRRRRPEGVRHED